MTTTLKIATRILAAMCSSKELFENNTETKLAGLALNQAEELMYRARACAKDHVELERNLATAIEKAKTEVTKETYEGGGECLFD